MLVLGIDAHKRTHTVVAVDEAGRKLGQHTTTSATTADHLELVRWADQFGTDRRWAVEDCRHLSRRLERDLSTAGEAIVATEAHLGIKNGFWGLLARGATFDHGTQQRRTQPGRRLIRENRAALGAAAAIGNEHHFAWASGEPTPVARHSTGLPASGGHARWRHADHSMADARTCRLAPLT